MYYPVSLKVAGATCLVVGGGAVAWRKARALARAGARVTAVSPRFDARFGRLPVRRVRRAFRAADVRGAFLVVSATDDPAVNRAVFEACRRRGIPVNVVDRPELCTFIVPAVVRRGPVTVAVSTGGAFPGLAKALRRELERRLPRALGPRAARLARERRRVRRGIGRVAERMRRARALVRGFRLGRAAGP
jgi:uroporphyrin-III C-methyltransferase/precorrin-2 dehydrogenase/sirohydrochlorin ferrochelatase